MEPSDLQSQATASPSAAHPSEHGSVAFLLAELEAISRAHPDRVLRLQGLLSVDANGLPVEAAAGETLRWEPFALLIFRGFASSLTHPTAFDPDRPALPQGSRIETAELLVGPLDPRGEKRLAGPLPPESFLAPAAW